LSIRDWPEGERPREKLLQRGPQALSDAELLAIFLRTGVAGKSAVDLARELVARFGGLRALLRADQARFCAAKGLGQAKYVQLQAVLEIARRHLGESLAEPQGLKDPVQAKSFLRAQLRDLDHEAFAALFLDTQHRVLAFEVLARGTLNSASVYPREVVKSALRHNAGALIFLEYILCSLVPRVSSICLSWLFFEWRRNSCFMKSVSRERAPVPIG
jgi:DNA repair protein RadC